MKTRLILLIVALAGVIAIRWWLSTVAESSSNPRPNPAAPGASRNEAPPVSGQPTIAGAAQAEANDRSHLADDLNSPGGTIGNDVRILDDILAHWVTNFPRTGNPVGTNAEITAALAGKNKLGLALIPPDHPAINASGELVDRWGTPFRFHQWSGSVMEVISAGPDRKFATADDTSSQATSAHD